MNGVVAVRESGGPHSRQIVTNWIISPSLWCLVSLCDTEEIPNGNRA